MQCVVYVYQYCGFLLNDIEKDLMGIVELDIGVYRKMCIFFYFQKYEFYYIMVIIKYYIMFILKLCGWVFLYFNYNINILYFLLKFCFF